MNEIESAFVAPFYLKMMGLNGLRLSDELWDEVVAAGAVITVGEVGWLLRTQLWRPVVMGAWFSVTVPPEQIETGLLTAMSQSQGSLTAPPLAAAATVVAGPAALPAMAVYLDRMMEQSRRDGSEEIVAAAVEHLGGTPPLTPPDGGRHAFHALCDAMLRLRDA